MSAARIGAGTAGAIAVALALAMTMTLASAPGAPGAGQAQAADCVPVQHSKKVVKRKKVRRHGRLVTLKKKKTVHWTTCEPPPPVTCAVPSSDLGVTARDQTGSTFSLSRACVSAGTVDVHLNNQGEDPHNVFLSPNGPNSAPVYRLPENPPYELGPLSQDDGSFALTAGQWYLWCDLLTHEQQGMYAYLTVS